MVIARQGKCANSEQCPVSQTEEVITVPEESDFRCPVCGHALKEVKVRASAKNRWIAIAASVAVLLLFAGFASYKHWIPFLQGGSSGAADEKNTILRLSGSNTIGDALMPALAEAYFKSQGATDVHTVAGSKAQEKIVLGTLPGERSASSIKIAAHGSATAFTSLADNSCDIGMASRRAKPDEISKLSSLGNMLAPASEHIVGLDGIAVIVNSANPVSELTKDQIMQIFTGASTTWPKPGPSQGGIKVYARDDKSGTFDTFKSLVLGGKPLAASAQRFENSNVLSVAVARDPNGIGFIGLPFVRSAKAIAVSEKGTAGLLPNKLTVATEDYSLSRRLYLYTSATPANKQTRQFVDFALSKQGQEVVAANGFIAQNVVLESQSVSASAPAEYKKLTQNAERLSLDFRFQPGELVQDNKAQVDLNRIVALIAEKGGAGNKIMLFGFADNDGKPAENLALSWERARAIENQLIQRGMRPAVVRGFGSELPVASNETGEGREKNRRVEIWIQK